MTAFMKTKRNVNNGTQRPPNQYPQTSNSRILQCKSVKLPIINIKARRKSDGRRYGMRDRIQRVDTCEVAKVTVVLRPPKKPKIT